LLRRFTPRNAPLRHTRRPTLSDSLEERIPKAKSSRSLPIFPKTFLIVEIEMLSSGCLILTFRGNKSNIYG
jgi:hypothetical protein